MATLIELSKLKCVEPFEPQLGFRQQPQRLIYLRPGALDWPLANLVNIESEFETEISPAEQLDDLLNSFCAGERLNIDRQIKILHHRKYGVWELKTPDLRLFGWFAHKDVFVWCETDFATRIKQYQLYQGYLGSVVRFRNELDLTPPKFLVGADPDGVATNIS